MKYAEKLAKFTSDTLQNQANENLTKSLYYLWEYFPIATINNLK